MSVLRMLAPLPGRPTIDSPNVLPSFWETVQQPELVSCNRTCFSSRYPNSLFFLTETGNNRLALIWLWCCYLVIDGPYNSLSLTGRERGNCLYISGKKCESHPFFQIAVANEQGAGTLPRLPEGCYGFTLRRQGTKVPRASPYCSGRCNTITSRSYWQVLRLLPAGS